MIALPPVDPADFIMKSGDEMQKSINKYFNEITLEDAVRPETLDPEYSPELIEKLQTQYYKTLERIWDTIPTYYHSSFQAAYKLPAIEDICDLDALQKAYDKAARITFWEKLGKSNYKDVLAYKLLLKENCENYLQAMHGQFIEAVSKIRS